MGRCAATHTCMRCDETVHGHDLAHGQVTCPFVRYYFCPKCFRASASQAALPFPVPAQNIEPSETRSIER